MTVREIAEKFFSARGIKISLEGEPWDALASWAEELDEGPVSAEFKASLHALEYESGSGRTRAVVKWCEGEPIEFTLVSLDTSPEHIRKLLGEVREAFGGALPRSDAYYIPTVDEGVVVFNLYSHLNTYTYVYPAEAE